MAFVNEEFPLSEKPKVDAFVASRPKYSRPPGSSKWTIDRERDACLIIIGKEGGGYDGPKETKHYVLDWQGEIIRFSGDMVWGRRIMSWRVFDVEIPDALNARKDEVLQLIQEALDALGLLYDRSRVDVVNVTFDQESSR